MERNTNKGRNEMDDTRIANGKFDNSQIKMFVKDAIRRSVGDGWSFIGPKMQRAIIDAEALQVACNQAANAISIEAIENVRDRMRAAAGLGE